MKIEKISEYQIRITLNHDDLLNRNIKLSELAYGSSKAQALFQDMMLKAYEDFGFETTNVPLMIEAVPLSVDSIMIVVTKVETPEEIEERLGLTGERPTHRTFKDHDEDDDIMPPAIATSETVDAIDSLMYRFDTLDEVTSCSHQIQHLYFGDSAVYKYSDKYFLLISPNTNQKTEQSILISILNEFGKRAYTSSLNQHFLQEHGIVILKTNAIDILAKYL
ncbi:MAG: competence protein [Epulopiscium sp. Nele67-Bin002]|nr:MAG: competence protein [Epulopiscium sp. Nuni2H_MBin001]OON91648.1 MAG: competence protein [Epulopiscium sp. Nele67-Bin002]OON92672.1 MAG: competence protein [Epulopiscium sp. Nele67-Bin001]